MRSGTPKRWLDGSVFDLLQSFPTQGSETADVSPPERTTALRNYLSFLSIPTHSMVGGAESSSGSV
jgi:hypothetical protein